MGTLRVISVSLFLLAAALEAEALNLKVREVRRSREAGTVSITYEVENASVDAVRLGRAELELSDPLGRRVEILPLFVPTHPLERGEAIFLRARTEERRLREAALLTVRLHPLPPFPFPVRDFRVPPVEARFDGPATRQSPPPSPLPAGPVLPGPAPWRLRLAGSVLAPTREAVLLLYALAQPGGTPETPAILEVRYSGGGSLLEARSLPVPAARDGEAYLEVLLPVAVARQVDGIEARLFSPAGRTIAVHSVIIEGHRHEGPGEAAGPGPEVRPAGGARRLLSVRPTDGGIHAP